MSVRPEDLKTEPAPAGRLGLAHYVEHLSQSSLGMFRRCPRQWQRRYLYGEKERPGEGMVVGSFFHEGIEFNLTQKVTSGVDRPLTEVMQYMVDEGVGKVLEQQDEEPVWDTSAEAAARDSLTMITSYYNGVIERVQPLAVEEKFSYDVPGVAVPIIGYVDVRTEPRVLDFKTGKQAARVPKPSWKLQGDLYTVAVGKPVEFHTISRKGQVTTPLESEALAVTPLSEAQKTTLNYSIRAMVRTLEHFLATYGPEQDWPTWGAIPDWSQSMLPCNYCGWREGCPAWTV